MCHSMNIPAFTYMPCTLILAKIPLIKHSHIYEIAHTYKHTYSTNYTYKIKNDIREIANTVKKKKS